MEHLGYLLSGLGNGAVFAALALALVLTFRSSGVINFGTGATAAYTAYVYSDLRTGHFLILVPGLPTRVSIGGPLSLWPALIISVAIAAIFGLVLYLLIFRPLRTAPPVARAVASLGVALVMAGLIIQKLGSLPPTASAIYPMHTWKHGDLIVLSDRVFFALTMIGLALILTVAFRYTSFGLATRASAESERGAYLSGISPDRIAAYNWMLSSAVAGLAGILITPIASPGPDDYLLFIVPALAAAVLAGFTNLVVAVLAGIVIGALQGEITGVALAHPSLPGSGLKNLVPLVLILAVLVVRARPLPGRGAIILQNLGRAPRPRHVWPTTAVMVVVTLVGLFVLHDRWRTGLVVSLIMGIVALSSVVITGYCGQISLAQMTIAGAAGFLVGPLTVNWHIPFPLAPLLAAAFAMVLGVAIGLPALRIRGLTVAVVTFALAFAVESFWFTNNSFIAGADNAVPTPKIFGYDLGIGVGHPRIRFGVLCLIVLTIVAVGVAMLRRSRLGSQMLAIRANERSAAAAGIQVARVKVMAFAIAAFIAGLGGALLAYQQGSVSAQGFGAVDGLLFFGTVYLTGITSVSGGLLAGISAATQAAFGLVYIFVDEVFSASGWYTTVASVLLVITVIMNPEGIVGPAHALLAKRRSQADGDADASVGSVVALNPEEHERHAGVRADAPVELDLRNVSVHYGGVVAVDGVSFGVPRGSIVGVIGPNGAGKTTLIDAISGFAPQDGDVVLGERSLSGLPPHKRVHAGLGRTFQAIELYDDLSVTENVKVGLTAATRTHDDGSKVSNDEQLGEIFALLGLSEVRGRPAGELSQGQRQLVSVARALAGRPDVLLLDEPAGGLDTNESHWLGERLRNIRDSGVTILLVDHDMSLVLGLCDTIHVLNFGKVIASGTPAEIRADRGVAAAYLGTTHAEEVTV